MSGFYKKYEIQKMLAITILYTHTILEKTNILQQL